MTKTQKVKLEDYVRHLFNLKREALSRHLKEFGRDEVYDREMAELSEMRNLHGNTCAYGK